MERNNQPKAIFKVFSPFLYDSDCHCNFHSRWNREGENICINSVHETKRESCIIPIKSSNIKIEETLGRPNPNILIVRSNKAILLRKEKNSVFYVENMFTELNRINKWLCYITVYARIKTNENYYNKNLVGVDADTIIIFDPHVRIQFLEWIRKNNPNKRIILWFWNTIHEIGKNIPLERVPQSIEKWSYSEYDCKKYGLKYNTTFYPYEMKHQSSRQLLYDVCFIGKDKGRLKKLLEIKDLLESKGLKTYFHISPTHQYELKKNPLYKSKIPYSQVDAIIAASKSILDCEVSNSAGPTIRPLEAMYRKKKLISDNKSLKKEDYYDKANIFIYGEDDINNIVEFISTPFKEYDEAMLEKYSMKGWIERFF